MNYGALGKQRPLDLRQMEPHPHGAPFGVSLKLPFFHTEYSTFRTNRRRLNAYAILLNVIVPWLLFCFVFAICSFTLRYYNPGTCFAMVAIILLLTVGKFGFQYQLAKIRKEKETEDEHEPMWYGFLAVCCLLAIIAGIIAGSLNFNRHMQPFYNLNHLNTFRDIDPKDYVGEQLVDAGRVNFKDGVYVDVSHSMGFRNDDTYCVAPIVSANLSAKDNYWDFWAVGKNCCSGVQADFHCENYLDIRKMGGLRLLNDEDRPFYRLAVQQAEATYKITTHKPLFFTWMYDPIQWAQRLQSDGFLMFMYGIITALVIQVCLVATATLAYAKEMPERPHMHHKGPGSYENL